MPIRHKGGLDGLLSLLIIQVDLARRLERTWKNRLDDLNRLTQLDDLDELNQLDGYNGFLSHLSVVLLILLSSNWMNPNKWV